MQTPCFKLKKGISVVMKINEKWRKILMMVMALILLVSVGKILFILVEQAKENQAFHELSQQVSQKNLEMAEDISGPEADSSAVEKIQKITEDTAQLSAEDVQIVLPPVLTAMKTDTETGILMPYLDLYKENEDFFGWIRIPDTKVDYPVMFTPEDPEYYIHRDFKKEDSKNGTPFLDAAYTEEGNLYIVYGHHMKNRTMFGSLPFYEKEEYWKQHPYILFNTLYEQGIYEIVSVFYSKIYRDDEEGFRYYQYKSLQDEEIFDNFNKGIQKSALYDTGVQLSYGDSVLLLSTCSYHTDEGRFVVVARKMKNEVIQK